MNNSRLLGVLCAGYVSLVSTSINASLIDRGNGLIYDPDLDITWMQDAYYLRNDPLANGKILRSRGAAISWADDLVFGGLDDWRLPSTFNVDPSCGTDDTTKGNLTLTPCSAGEMGHLFYSEKLPYKPGDATYSTKGAFGSLGMFDNVYGGGYWTSEDYAWTDQPYEDSEGEGPRTPRVGYGWLFYFGGDPGAHKTILKLGNSRAAWAVRDGDVLLATVPLPAAVWLFGSGLLGLAGMARRRTARG